MTVDANDLIAALKLQREVQATEAAMMAAACEALKRELAVAQARIAELEGAAKSASSPPAPER